MKKISAQSIVEYGVCIAIVLAALLGMQVYVKRGLSGRYKELVDHTTKSSLGPRQYEPYYLDDEFTVSQVEKTNEDIQGEGWIKRDLEEDKLTVTGKSIRGPE